MRFAEVLNDNNHTCIFVSFPDIKLNILNAVGTGRKDAKRKMLCVQVDEHTKLHDFSFVSEASFLRFSFAAKQVDQHVVHRVMKLKPSSWESEEILEYAITNTISIVRRETGTSYEYVLREKEAGTAVMGRRKSKRKKTEKMKVIEHVLFIVPKTVEQGISQNRRNVSNKNKSRVSMLESKKKRYSLYAAEERRLEGTMRKQQMRSFEKGAILVPVSVPFLGPGDQLFPLPRAEPCV